MPATTSAATPNPAQPPHNPHEFTAPQPHTQTDVLIVGSGFGGLAAARVLAKTHLAVTLISTTPAHVFQPLLYQVATGVLAPDVIAPNTAELLNHPNITVITGTVESVDAEHNTATYVHDGGRQTISFHDLIAATGASQSYFGNDQFADVTFSLKTTEDAIRLREHIRQCVEKAITTTEIDTRSTLLSFVVVGAGATGVEVSGQIKELSQRYFPHVTHLTPHDIKVTLVEGVSDVLPVYGGKLSQYAADVLRRAGVTLMMNSLVTDVDDTGVVVKSNDGTQTRIDAATVVWSAGVQANAFAAVLAEATGCPTDRAGRLQVNPDLSVGKYGNIYAIGDMMSLDQLPGQSPVAIQGGQHVAKMLLDKKARTTPFTYFDKGSMAVINRFNAVAYLLGGKLTLTGPIAWLMWLAIHMLTMAGIKNQGRALVSWLRSFGGRNRPALDRSFGKPRRPQR